MYTYFKIINLTNVPPTNTSTSSALGSKYSPYTVIVVPPFTLPSLGVTPVITKIKTSYVHMRTNVYNKKNFIQVAM